MVSQCHYFLLRRHQHDELRRVMFHHWGDRKDSPWLTHYCMLQPAREYRLDAWRREQAAPQYPYRRPSQQECDQANAPRE